MSQKTFRSSLDAALFDAAAALCPMIGEEHLYAFAIYTTPEFEYLCASANTEEGLSRTRDRYAASDSSYAGDDGLTMLRWSPCDWAYHDFSPALNDVSIPSSSPAATYTTLLRSLKALDRAGVLHRERSSSSPALLLVCGDMSRAFFHRGLQALNRRAVEERCLAEYDEGLRLLLQRGAERTGRTRGLKEGLQTIAALLNAPVPAWVAKSHDADALARLVKAASSGSFPEECS